MADEKNIEERLFKLQDSVVVPDPIVDYSRYNSANTPIVIDNGSYQCRVGWAAESSPEPAMIFKNLIAKPRKERGKKEGELQVGNSITNIEAVRFQLRTQFDRDVVTHLEAQEQVFDHIFSNLGIDTEGCVNHPIILTESFLNPNYSRNLMSELLFECYGTPSVVYGVDGLFSWINDTPQVASKDSLVLRLGQHCTHVIPILNGSVVSEHARRINVGGIHITGFFHRLMQLKNPLLAPAISLSRAEELLFQHCRVSNDFFSELLQWESIEYQKKNMVVVQLPFTAAPTPSTSSLLSLEQQQQRRRELAKRLGEINAKKREERLAEDEESLSRMLSVQEMMDDGDDDDIQQALEEFDVSNRQEFNKAISNLKARIRKTKSKILAALNASLDETPEIATTKNEVKISKLLQELPMPNDEQDMEKWISELKQKRQTLLEKRNARKQKKQDMAKRRTAAAQERMRIISQLAKKDKREDTFGMKDEDWDVYKAIQKDGGDSDSEEESERLAELEEILGRYAPEVNKAQEQKLMPLFTCIPEKYQFALGTELIRVPELLFQPSMIGHEQGGLSETIEYVLKKFDADEQHRLVQDIYITGGSSRFPGLLSRLNQEVMEMRPFQSSFNIRQSSCPSLSAWYGARQLGLDRDWLMNSSITKNMYDEMGGEYLASHIASNPSWHNVPMQVDSQPGVVEQMN
ncbi:actin-related protein 5 [Neocloeon triangulifer]|uniref:actin-related protein 5 n=1 Tax=Neocloeon triangulifer TaxID=2078957 RepID=UPI00286F9857|nr:actin-related protein 5 [Neocloeon triangulifer]